MLLIHLMESNIKLKGRLEYGDSSELVLVESHERKESNSVFDF
jgi:hypothetical protein